MIKWVIVEQQQMSRRFVALRGLSFESEEAAQAHLVSTFNPKYHYRYRVESRELKPDDASLRMHCQCCGRAILANQGSIAHHGYERPDYGYQTASCMGAKKPPFEVDRAVLGRMIVALKEMEARMQSVRDQIADEILPIERHWKGFGPKAEKKSFKFTRENFKSDEARKALRDSGRYESAFDDLLKVELASRDNGLRSIGKDIAMQQARFDGWKQTHKWKDGLWVTQ